MARAFKIFLVLLGLYGLLWLPGVWIGSDYIETPFGMAAVAPVLSIYVFHALGVPGLLEHNGACGWGWCAPTLWGWFFATVVWLGLLWLVSYGLALVRRTHV